MSVFDDCNGKLLEREYIKLYLKEVYIYKRMVGMQKEYIEELKIKFNQKTTDPVIYREFGDAKTHLAKYKKLYDKTIKGVLVEYTKKKFGRMYAKEMLSLCCMKTEVRNGILYKIFEDLDINGASNNITLQICNKLNYVNELKITELIIYNNNREEYLKEIAEAYDLRSNNNREIVKVLMISFSFLGGPNKWLDNYADVIHRKEGTKHINDKLSKYRLELKKIALKLKENNKELYNYALNVKLEKFKLNHPNEKFCEIKNNVLGSFFATYIFEVEYRIVRSVIDYLKTTPLLRDLFGIYEYDGIKLLKSLIDEFNSPEYGQGMTGVINLLNLKTEELTGFNLKWVNKSMESRYILDENNKKPFNVEEIVEEEIDESVFEIEELEKIEESKDKQIINGVENDLDCARKILKLYPHWVTCNNELYVFDSTTGLWDSRHITHVRLIQTLEKELFIIGYKTDGNKCLTKKSYGSCASLQNGVLSQLKALVPNDEWLNDVDSSSFNKLLFKDGYYDMRTGIFYNYFNSSIVFFNRINYDFPYKNGLYNITESQKKYIQSVKDRMIRNALDEKSGNFMIRQLSIALSGDKQQIMVIGLGETSAGKSNMMTSIKNATDGYSGSFNAQNLVYNVKSSSDEGQKMRWAMLLRHKRIIFASEIGSNDVIDSNQVKKLTGDEPVTGRLHNGNETSFQPHFTMFGFFNDLKGIAPMDPAVDRRLLIFNYTKTYVENPIHDFHLQADNNIKYEIQTKECKEAILWILLNDYLEYKELGKMEIPDEIKKAKEVWFPTNDTNIIQAFELNFKITNDVNDFISSRELTQWKLDSGFETTSSVAFSIALKKHCKIKKYENVYTKDKKVSGKCQSCWFGIKSLMDTTNNII